MKLLFVRHGDPDYSIDSLTDAGWVEAELLSERLSLIDTKAYYCSPFGRAKDTASCTLKKVNREAVICDWLKEFHADCGQELWDWLVSDWENQECVFDKDNWFNVYSNPEMVKKEYDYVINQFDQCLFQHGYKREGLHYKAEEANDDTIVFFCHFGLECVLLSHLMNISPFVLWHTTVAAPSSVTVVNTEEREEQAAIFRMASYGDISHLYGKREPSFAARFCTMYSNKDQRH